jgi:hypothetical protein
MSIERIVLKAPPQMRARPKCPGCGKRLRPYMATVENARLLKPGDFENNIDPQFTARKVEWTGDYHSYGEFCTLRCCEQFANMIVKKVRALGPKVAASMGVR